MVRLKKNRWYSSENQHRLGRQASSDSSGSRRLISLVFLLALVLLLMQKMSDPGVVRRAFQAVGVPLDRETLAATHVTVSPSDRSESAFVSSLETESQWNSAVDMGGIGENAPAENQQWAATCSDLVPRILKSASPEVIDALAHWLFAVEISPTQAVTSTAHEFASAEIALLTQLSSELVESFTRQLNQLPEEESAPDISSENTDNGDLTVQAALGQNPKVHDSWLESLNRFSVEWEKLLDEALANPLKPIGGSPGGTAPDATLQAATVKFVDQSLVDRLRDGAAWRKSESLTFWRFLQRGVRFEYSTQTDPALLSTHQLQAEFAEHRNHWIRLRASVHRVDSVQRSYPPFGLRNYWLLWLRGADGSSQPVAAYTSAAIATQLERAVHEGEKPEIELTALVAKRVAYYSPSGIQVAPTLFAGSIIQFAKDESLAFSASETAIAKPVATAGLVALLVSMLFVLPIWHQSRRKRASKLTEPLTRNPNRLLPLWLGVFLLSPSSLIAAQTAPPWAKSAGSEQSIESITRQRLAGLLDDERVRELEESLDGTRRSASDTILRTLFSLNQVGWNRLWEKQMSIGEQSGVRLRPFEMSGWVTSVIPMPISEQQQEWFSDPPRRAIYLLNLVDTETQRVLPRVLCRSIPDLWRERANVHQPAVIRGFALESDGGHSNHPDDQPHVVCVFTEAPQWVKIDEKDTQQNAHPIIPDHLIELMDAGWDLYWLDILRSENEKALSDVEREPFSRLLQITGSGILQCSSQPKDPFEVLGRASEYLGCCVDWNVRLVTGSQTKMKNPDGSELTYVQFDGFVKIPGRRVEYLPSKGQERVIFDGEFPVTIVISGNNEFIPSAEQGLEELSWKVGRHARLQGRFYRMWSYRSERLETTLEKGRQLAPLIVAVSLTPSRPKPNVGSPFVWFGAALCLGVVLIMGGIILSVFRDTFRSPS